MAASVLLLGASLAVRPFLGGEFLPDFRESNFVIFMAGKPDSSLSESVRVGARMGARLMEIPGVQSVASIRYVPAEAGNQPIVVFVRGFPADSPMHSLVLPPNTGVSWQARQAGGIAEITATVPRAASARSAVR